MRAAAACLMAMAVLMTGAAFADDEHVERRQGAEQASRGAAIGELVPLATIVASVLERYPGRIVETEFETEGGQPHYEFHVMRADGRVIEIKVDARDGSYLGREAED